MTWPREGRYHLIAAFTLQFIYWLYMWDTDEEKNKITSAINGKIALRQVPKCLSKTVTSPLFLDLVIRVYQYINYLEKVQKRCYTEQSWTSRTNRSSRLSSKPKFNQTSRIKELSKEIGLSYGGFLMKQSKFRSFHQEGIYYEALFSFISNVVKSMIDGCDQLMVKKEINRLFRTNTFNTKLGYEEIRTDRLEISIEGRMITQPRTLSNSRRSINYKQFRREVLTQRSFIKPYVNNRSCFKSKQTRSPIISLIIPTKQYNLFNFETKRHPTTENWI